MYAHAVWGWEKLDADVARGFRDAFSVGKGNALAENLEGYGAVHRSGVEVEPSEVFGDFLGRGAFARRGRSIERDDESAPGFWG
jgi:hypothetical protein